MAAPRIALFVETSREYGRGLLRGIIRYQREHGPWSIYFKPQGLGAPVPSWLTSWRGDGIIARIDDLPMARALARTSVPVVDVRNALPGLRFPAVATSNKGVAQLAIDHFIAQGFRRFAFCGTRRGENRNQDERSDLFARFVKEKGYTCHVYDHPKKLPRSWDVEQKNVVTWLKTLPTPVAILTCNDDRGQQVIDACLRANLKVPDEVAILGVDNDPFMCNLSTPQLSSIDVFPERIGYEAATLLAHLMAGGNAPRKPILFDPRGLILRQSSDITAVNDLFVAQAAKLIRDFACEPLSIEQLLSRVPISRSGLFRRFKSTLGRSPKKEQTRIRLDRAKALLAESSLPVEDIARQTFHTDSKHFISVFVRETGITPKQYRKKGQFGLL